jgi:CHAD domain-containing protein
MRLSTTRSELLRKRVDPFTRVLPAVADGDVPALHRARVASRRLRELLPMLQLETDTARKLNRRLRKVTSRLGTVRELDVLLLLIDELHVSRPARSAALSRVGITVAKKRDEARKRLSSKLPMADMARLGRKLDRLVGVLRTAEASSSKTAARNWRWAVEARVASRATRLSEAVEGAGAVYLPERLHAVRIAVKKLRYAVELLAEIGGGTTRADLGTLKRSQDLLGQMHDWQVLMDVVREVQASLMPPNLTLWHDLDALIASLEDDCRHLHARYMRGRDRLAALADRLRTPVQPAAVPVRVQPSRRAG